MQKRVSCIFHGYFLVLLITIAQIAGSIEASESIIVPEPSLLDETLIKAVRNRDISCLAMLLSRSDTSRKDAQGLTLLHWAAYAGDKDVFALCVKAIKSELKDDAFLAYIKQRVLGPILMATIRTEYSGEGNFTGVWSPDGQKILIRSSFETCSLMDKEGKLLSKIIIHPNDHLIKTGRGEYSDTQLRIEIISGIWSEDGRYIGIYSDIWRVWSISDGEYSDLRFEKEKIGARRLTTFDVTGRKVGSLPPAATRWFELYCGQNDQLIASVKDQIALIVFDGRREELSMVRETPTSKALLNQYAALSIFDPVGWIIEMPFNLIDRLIVQSSAKSITIESLALSSDGKSVLMGTRDHCARIWAEGGCIFDWLIRAVMNGADIELIELLFQEMGPDVSLEGCCSHSLLIDLLNQLRLCSFKKKRITEILKLIVPRMGFAL